MAIEQHMKEFISLKASCATFLKFVNKEGISKKDKKMYQQLYNDNIIYYNILKDHIDFWYNDTIYTINQIETEIKKIKRNNSLDINTKEVRIKTLMKDITYLNTELNKINILTFLNT